MARESSGAALLAAQHVDGRWGGGFSFPRGTGTFDTLHMRCQLERRLLLRLSDGHVGQPCWLEVGSRILRWVGRR